ncbi:hypothetical protein [Romboutsia sp.]|uniref:hypothetical protein n=1 Tax=Romboutsia sp. TaxID=1965302 RepID=UPI002BE944CF|nr:hypothetical protein [Romboutsia sp.]HSQ88611.1 hypothetical protein [Romboutsia sp.]
MTNQTKKFIIDDKSRNIIDNYLKDSAILICCFTRNNKSEIMIRGGFEIAIICKYEDNKLIQ